jgi:hypothetical protein
MDRIALIAGACALVLLAVIGYFELQKAGAPQMQNNVQSAGRDTTANGREFVADRGTPQSDVDIPKNEILNRQAGYAELAAKQKNARWVGDYRFTVAIAGKEESAEVTQYSMNDKQKSRIDMFASGKEARAYTLSGIAYACTKDGTSWKCQIRQSNTAPGMPGSTESYGKILDAHPPSPDGTIELAGTTAHCFLFDNMQDYIFEASEADEKTQQGMSTRSQMSLRTCLTDDGIPLYMKTVVLLDGKESMRMEMVAKSYGTSVSESDFELPA